MLCQPKETRIRLGLTKERGCSFDVRHIPQGCATWPAAWEVHEDGWPDYGEVDIIEGVNDIEPNASALHTSPGCTMPEPRVMTGYLRKPYC